MDLFGEEEVGGNLVSIVDSLVSLVVILLRLSNIEGVDEGVITFDKRLERGVGCEVFSSVSVGRDGKILVSAGIEFDSEGFFLSFIIVVLYLLRKYIFCTKKGKVETRKETKEVKKTRKMDCIYVV